MLYLLLVTHLITNWGTPASRNMSGYSWAVVKQTYKRGNMSQCGRFLVEIGVPTKTRFKSTLKMTSKSSSFCTMNHNELYLCYAWQPRNLSKFCCSCSPSATSSCFMFSSNDTTCRNFAFRSNFWMSKWVVVVTNHQWKHICGNPLVMIFVTTPLHPFLSIV